MIPSSRAVRSLRGMAIEGRLMRTAVRRIVLGWDSTIARL